MTQPTRIHQGKDAKRIHYIVEWAEKFSLSQADIMRETGADKGLVSRWFKGSNPGHDYLQKLAALFHTDVEGLFRHPDDDWFAKFFKDRSEEELRRMKLALEASFPRKTGTNGQ